MNDNNTAIARSTGPDLILHPVRMRIILALASGPATTAELAERLADVPPATLYRHLDALRRGEIIAVAEERRVRGATERRYVLHPGAATLTPDDLATATPEDHLRWFAAFLAALLGAYARYLNRGTPDLVRDGVGYREVVLNLTDDDLAEMSAALNAALAPYLMREPGPGSSPRLFATVLMPGDPPGPPARQPRKETPS